MHSKHRRPAETKVNIKLKCMPSKWPHWGYWKFKYRYWLSTLACLWYIMLIQKAMHCMIEYLWTCLSAFVIYSICYFKCLNCLRLLYFYLFMYCYEALAGHIPRSRILVICEGSSGYVFWPCHICKWMIIFGLCLLKMVVCLCLEEW